MPTRVLVTGDRGWQCTDLAIRVVRRLAEKYGADLVVVHGGAPGVDRAFAQACRLFRVREEEHPAEWDDLGQPDARLRLSATGSHYDANAGPRRNQGMVDLGADFALAVHKYLPKSKGTRDCVEKCLAAGVPVYVLDSDAAEPRRITEA